MSDSTLYKYPGSAGDVKVVSIKISRARESCASNSASTSIIPLAGALIRAVVQTLRLLSDWIGRWVIIFI